MKSATQSSRHAISEREEQYGKMYVTEQMPAHKGRPSRCFTLSSVRAKAALDIEMSLNGIENIASLDD